MGLFDKVKNLFTEEVDEPIEEKKPEEKKEPIQKEMIQVEIPSPTRVEMHENDVEEKEPEYKFPFFDDNDFDNIDVKPTRKEEKKQTYKEIYKPTKEEKKSFRPSPIISPVYGILDKGYSSEKDLERNEIHSSYYSPKEVNVDAIRNKAYGSLESDIETTLFGEKLEEEKEETKTLEEIKQELKQEIKDEIKEETPKHSKDDITSLLEEEMEKPAKDEKHPRKISDQELFSLINSMYEKENK